MAQPDDSACVLCSSREGRVGEGKERGEPGEQVEGNGGRGLGRTDSCRVAGAA